MNPARFKYRITIQRGTEYEDEKTCVSKAGWVDYKTVWAGVNNLYGKEYWTAKQYGAENTVEFTIRYCACPDLSIRDRIKFNGRVFNITFVDNVQYKNETIKIKAVEVA